MVLRCLMTTTKIGEGTTYFELESLEEKYAMSLLIIAGHVCQ